MKVAITGAGGFVGQALCRHWRAQGIEVVPFTRHTLLLEQMFSLEKQLEDVDVVVHAAARAHVLNEKTDDPLSAFRNVNVEGTHCLCRQAAAAGVSRFIFISSIGVLGRSTNGRGAFTQADHPQPMAPYAISKHEAEQVVQTICSQTRMQSVIIRPPLICGPGAKGNLLRLLRLVQLGWPLPLAGLDNCRSFLSLSSFLDLLTICLDHPHATGRPLLAADRVPISTAQVVHAMANAMRRPTRLFSASHRLLDRAAYLVGKHSTWLQLSGNLEVDPTATAYRVGWEPYQNSKPALAEMATAYLREHHKK